MHLKKTLHSLLVLPLVLAGCSGQSQNSSASDRIKERKTCGASQGVVPPLRVGFCVRGLPYIYQEKDPIFSFLEKEAPVSFYFSADHSAAFFEEIPCDKQQELESLLHKTYGSGVQFFDVESDCPVMPR
jgi:hypothetical protein